MNLTFRSFILMTGLLVVGTSAVAEGQIGSTQMSELDVVVPMPAPVPNATHKVVKGENDWTIAKKFGISVKELHKLNPGVNWDRLQIGQKLKVPGKAKKASGNQATAQKKTSIPDTDKVAEVNATDVLVRKGPGKSYERVARVQKGQSASVLEIRDGWTKVRFSSGTTGWIIDRYVDVTAKAKAEKPKSDEGSDLVVTPPVDEKTTDKKGETIEIVPVTKPAEGVKKAAEKAVDSKAVTAPPLEQKIESFDHKIAVVQKSDVIVRKGAKIDSDRVAKVQKGRSADILAVLNGWTKVKFASGTTGWIRDDLIKHVDRGEWDAHLAQKRANALKAAKALEADKGKVEGLLKTARSKMGTRYVYGASRSSAFDCSGFVLWVFKKHGISLPRTSASQSRVGVKIARANLQAGDLVFFRTRGGTRVSHVGIYIGNNKFIHASSGGGKVQINSLGERYYNARYVVARRMPALGKKKAAAVVSEATKKN